MYIAYTLSISTIYLFMQNNLRFNMKLILDAYKKYDQKTKRLSGSDA